MWWVTAVKADPTREHDWTAFKKAFEHQYQPPELARTARMNLYAVRQEGAVNTYCSRFVS